MENPLLWTIAEHHVAKLDPALGDLKFARPRGIFLEFTGVEEIIEHADAEERRGHIDVESRDALHRLVQHDDRGDEREQASGLIAANDHGIAAIEHDGGDGEAPETFHDRTCAGAYRGELVGCGLEASDRGPLPLAHEVLEGEGLDDADALRGPWSDFIICIAPVNSVDMIR